MPSTTPHANVPIQDAATVVICRDHQPGIEVLLLRRKAELVFAPNCWVFPGGRVEAEDIAQGHGDSDSAHRLAAAREAKEETGLTIDPSTFTAFSHWTTPPGSPRRFATWFYLCEIQDRPEITFDEAEINASEWIPCQQALDEFLAKQRKMMIPTAATLYHFSQFNSVAEARKQALQVAPAVFTPEAMPKDLAEIMPGFVASAPNPKR